MRIKIRTIIIAIACLMTITIPYLSQTTNNIKNLAIELLLTVWLLHHNTSKEIRIGNFPIILLWVVMVLCTLISLGLSSRLVNAVVTGYSYVSVFFILSLLAKRYGVKTIINDLFKVILLFALIEDAALFFTRGNGIGSTPYVKYYILGNKFFVSYTHLFLLALFLAHDSNFKNERTRKRVFWLLLLYSAFVCYRVNCNTGIAGCIAIGIMGLFIDRKSKVCVLLSKPAVFVGVFVGLSFLLVTTNVILGNAFFQQIFMDLSHTNKILTGRVEMYHIALAAVYNRPILGYGINSTIVSDTLTWGNAQNGLLKMMLDYGLIGTISFLIVCWNAFSHKEYDSEDALSAYSIIAFLYAMAFCSMVEINISGYFFMALAILKSIQFQVPLKE